MNDRIPKNNAGQPRQPYGSEFEWVKADTLTFTSPDGLVTCRLVPDAGRDWTLQVESRGWKDAKSAQEIFHMIALVLLDEHGYSLRYDEFDFSILNKIGGGRLRHHGVTARKLLKEAKDLGMEADELDGFHEEFIEETEDELEE